MPRKKVDNRIRVLIENGVAGRRRSLVVVVGEKSRDQVVLLHHMLSKASVKARPSVLWCYKKELDFSSHRKKRMKQLQKRIKSGAMDVREDDPFDLFVSSTDIRYCYYSETHKILGNTFGMCVLQDFEALTPNLLARTVETVEGGGLIVILLRTLTSLRQLVTMTMDVHTRFRTESHQDVVGRFNERFLLSLADCPSCVVIDDHLNVLPISSHSLSLSASTPSSQEENSPSQRELSALQQSMADTQPVGPLLSSCLTLDQAKALLVLVEALSEQTLRSTVAVTAARGRGKSAALGLSIAAAVAFGYSNIFLTSPSPENLKTVFQFVFRGFDCLNYTEHQDYEAVQSTNPDFNKAVVRVNIFHEHRQTVQYIHPSDCHKLGQAELLCIDEAAAIPLPLVRNLIGPYLVFMASTVNGYEGTGRSLSLKLISQLRHGSGVGGGGGRVLKEVELEEPVRYSAGDGVERWLYDLLCLDSAKISRTVAGCPSPADCELYHVNRDTLFSHHKASEVFLHRLMSLYVSSHYKNTPNDIQLLSDAPAHRVFVLVPPVLPSSTSLPDVLCVLQVCLEGGISRRSVMKSLSRGKRASGDLIPWTVSQQFADSNFASLTGVRVVRIAVHPDLQGMGYGSRALSLLHDYFSGKLAPLAEAPAEVTASTTTEEEVSLLKETIAPRTNLPPLLCRLEDRPPETLEYIGVSYGLTLQLYRFWSRLGYVPVYLRQTPNDLTGEHSCIMLRPFTDEHMWLTEYSTDFRKRFLALLSYQFRKFPPALALTLSRSPSSGKGELSLETLFSPHDLRRLELYSRNMADHHLITDLLPALAQLQFSRSVLHLSAAQSAILLGLGLQHKTVDELQVSNLPLSVY
jgi:N-acetyltransferase 10